MFSDASKDSSSDVPESGVGLTSSSDDASAAVGGPYAVDLAVHLPAGEGRSAAGNHAEQTPYAFSIALVPFLALVLPPVRTLMHTLRGSYTCDMSYNLAGKGICRPDKWTLAVDFG